jgi:hypothetical protein
MNHEAEFNLTFDQEASHVAVKVSKQKCNSATLVVVSEGDMRDFSVLEQNDPDVRVIERSLLIDRAPFTRSPDAGGTTICTGGEIIGAIRGGSV